MGYLPIGWSRFDAFGGWGPIGYALMIDVQGDSPGLPL